MGIVFWQVVFGLGVLVLFLTVSTLVVPFCVLQSFACQLWLCPCGAEARMELPCKWGGRPGRRGVCPQVGGGAQARAGVQARAVAREM